MTINDAHIESHIHEVWALTNQLDAILWRIYDHPEEPSEDQVFNMVYAIRTLLDVNCEKLFDSYKKAYGLDEYASEEVKALRAALFKKKKKKKNKDIDGRC